MLIRVTLSVGFVSDMVRAALLRVGFAWRPTTERAENTALATRRVVDTGGKAIVIKRTPGLTTVVLAVALDHGQCVRNLEKP